ncbi:MAG: hypothetical protein DAHOPDDO_01275 [Ignavibacteriaceae bacterium]|nr:hypothetical protein [Ignavibacteriaceae bacterium]OQY72472.1 MAG: prevent-host-death protein [Ignavibacteriales bacterium UTCHB2]
MNTYTYNEAKQKFSLLLEKAKKEGKVLIKRKDGTVFELKPVASENKSPLDVKGISLDIEKDEIIDIIRETRSR